MTRVLTMLFNAFMWTLGFRVLAKKQREYLVIKYPRWVQPVITADLLNRLARNLSTEKNLVAATRTGRVVTFRFFA